MSTIRELLDRYTKDAFLGRLWSEVRKAGPIRSISVDVTRRCNLRCAGCYFFAEDMDAVGDASDDDFESFLDSELERGTNFVTVLGGEPSLAVPRVRRLHERFRLMVVTNGLRKIPYEGLENLPIAVSVWGDRDTDRRLRGWDRLDVFDKALENYREDPRVVWYFTLSAAGGGGGVAESVDRCVDNGNLVGFNYYGDLAAVGGEQDHRQGFAGARRLIDQLIDRHPDRIVFTSYLNKVISTGRLFDQKWGYDVCGSITFDHPKNRDRVSGSAPYNPHFRAYNPDFSTTRRCCVGEDRDCSTCFDVWAHLSWISLSLERHLTSFEDFQNWLTTVYLFYGVIRMLRVESLIADLPEIHRRTRDSRFAPRPPSPIPFP